MDTVTNKYSQDVAVPPEFPELLRGLTREILRAQPTDINKFAYEYFATELRKRAMNQTTEEE